MLPTSFPGFVAAPAGTFNGPISDGTLMTNTADPNVLAEIENGSINGYLRCWGSEYSTLAGIVCDSVLQFPNATETQLLLDTVQSILTSQSNLTTFAVGAPTGAVGYSTHNAVIPGSTNLAVSFSRGDYAAVVLSATLIGGISTAQIEQLAQMQWAAFPSVAVPATGSTVPTTLPSNVPTTLSSALISSSGVGGIEALAVLFFGAVVTFVLAVLAIDLVGRRRRVHPVFDDPGPESQPSEPTHVEQA